jgi:hypothetical protein
LLERIEGLLLEQVGGFPQGLIEEVGHGLSGFAAAKEALQTVETFASGHTGDGDDQTPKVFEVASAKLFSQSSKKALAKGGETSDLRHRSFLPVLAPKPVLLSTYRKGKTPSFGNLFGSKKQKYTV